MELIEKVKPRLGIFYSDAAKDLEIEGMIEGATAYFKAAGWTMFDEHPLAVEAVVLYCKMAQSTDPQLLTNHPVLLSFIAQGRVVSPPA